MNAENFLVLCICGISLKFVSSFGTNPSYVWKQNLDVSSSCLWDHQNVNDDMTRLERRRFLMGSLIPLVAWDQSKLLSNAMEDENGSSSISTSSSSSALKPFAPLEALLPAARVKLLIDETYNVTQKLVETSKNVNIETEQQQQQLLAQLQMNLLQEEYDFFSKGSKNKSTFSATTTITTPRRDIYKERYDEQRKDIPWSQKPMALLVQAGDYRQSQILQKRQKQMEYQNEIRAALNTYTRALQFDSKKFVLTASPTDRKRLIRTDTIPDIQTVITSDLDLRDLYRNQLLTSWEDARAELKYQLTKQPNNSLTSGDESLANFDATDLLDVLKEARDACNSWFSFISTEDVEDAMNVVLAERKS